MDTQKKKTERTKLRPLISALDFGNEYYIILHPKSYNQCVTYKQRQIIRFLNDDEIQRLIKNEN